MGARYITTQAKMALLIQTITTGPFQENGFIVAREGGSTCVLIDPGDEAERWIAVLKELHLTPEIILNTHGHLDHIGAVPALSNAYGLDVIWDEQLTNASEIYIEAGDHENLIHMHGDEFCKLMEDLPHSIISAGKDYSRWINN